MACSAFFISTSTVPCVYYITRHPPILTFLLYNDLRMHKAWIVTVSMGYGHERAALPLLPIAVNGQIIIANDYNGIPDADRKRWESMESGYYAISRIKEHGGFIGEQLFRIFDRFQTIHDIDDPRDERRATFQLRQIYRYIRGKFGRHLIQKLSENPAPLVTTFFTVAHMADVWKYPKQVYVVTTDSDISRAWVSQNPLANHFIYFASTGHAARHLEKYGVPPKHIVISGFPLPALLTENAETDFKTRMARFTEINGRPITITFVVGGAGAQVERGEELIERLAPLIREGRVTVNLIAGKREDVARKFEQMRDREGLAPTQVAVVRADHSMNFFSTFNDLLRRTDLLWTKPSELSFYAALGLPVVMTSPVGAQEIRNREWLLKLGSGMDQPGGDTIKEWFLEQLENGSFSRAAKAGFEKMERNGTKNIMEYVGSH